MLPKPANLIRYRQAATNDELKSAVERAKARDTPERDITGVIRLHVPKGKIYDCPPERRPALLAGVARLGHWYFPLEPFFDEGVLLVAILTGLAQGQGGKFVVYSVGQWADGTDLPVAIRHIVNQGEPCFVAKQIDHAILELAKGPGAANVYIMPGLVRADLPKGQKGGTADIIAMLVLPLEADAAHDPATLLDRLPAPPNVEIESSPGNRHVAYFLDEAAMPELAGTKDAHIPVLDALTDAAGTDPGMKSLDKGLRIPGMLNWPDAGKVKKLGRDPEPFTVRLASPIRAGTISLEELRTAILTRYPNAFEATQKKETAGELDWNRRDFPHRPMPESELDAAVNSPVRRGTRSEACFGLLNEMRRRGNTPNEIDAKLSGRLHEGFLQHYAGAQALHEDIERLFKKSPPQQTMQALFDDTIQRDHERGETAQIERDRVKLMQAYDILNRDFAVATWGSKTIIADTRYGEIIGREKCAFLDMHTNWKVWTQDGTSNPKQKPVAPMWLSWKNCRKYVNPSIAFEPSQPDRPGEMLNLWRGWAIEPKEGDWGIIEELIRADRCGSDDALGNYILDWQAYGVQHPDAQFMPLLAFKSEAHGAGKGLAARIYGNLFGPHFNYIGHEKDLLGDFNAKTETALFVFVDEAIFAGSPKATEALKILITEPVRRIGRKFVDTYDVPNYLRFMLGTNANHAVDISQSNRRECVINVEPRYGPTDPYWDRFHVERTRFQGLLPALSVRQAYFHHLLTRDLNKFNVRDFPHTAEEANQKRMSLKGPARWLADVLENEVIGRMHTWGGGKLTIVKDDAFQDYKRADPRPVCAEVLTKTLTIILGDALRLTRPRTTPFDHRPCYEFATIEECKKAFEKHNKGEK